MVNHIKDVLFAYIWKEKEIRLLFNYPVLGYADVAQTVEQLHGKE